MARWTNNPAENEHIAALQSGTSITVHPIAGGQFSGKWVGGEYRQNGIWPPSYCASVRVQIGESNIVEWDLLDVAKIT